jgi:hypothetical protein
MHGGGRQRHRMKPLNNMAHQRTHSASLGNLCLRRISTVSSVWALNRQFSSTRSCGVSILSPDRGA